jgi:hypothetical protein
MLQAKATDRLGVEEEVNLIHQIICLWVEVREEFMTLVQTLATNKELIMIHIEVDKEVLLLNIVDNRKE